MILIKTAKKIFYLSIMLSIMLTAIFFLSPLILAQELSVEEAIQSGLENSSQIKDAEDSIQEIERSLAKEIASNDWQLNLNTGYGYNFHEEEDKRNLNFAIGRTFLSGLKINPETKISIDEDLDASLNISLSKALYPQLPTNMAEKYYRADKELLKAHNNLIEQKVSSIFSWLEIYLNIDRMTDRQDIFIESFRKAEDNLAIVLEREELGDAGRNDILTAELSLENARYSFEEAGMQLEDFFYNLSNELGFPVEENIMIKDSNHYIDGLRKKAADYSLEYIKKENSSLMAIVEENNIDIQANLLDREILKQELLWLEQEDKAVIDLTGTYNSENEDLSLGLGLSYQLYDGGQHKLALEDKKIEIADNISDYNDLYNKLKLELKGYIDSIELSQMALKKEKLSLARSKYELEIAEKQLAVGLIDYLEYQDSWISAAEAKIDLESLEDQLFIDRLELIKFIDINKIVEIIGGF